MLLDTLDNRHRQDAYAPFGVAYTGKMLMLLSVLPENVCAKLIPIHHSRVIVNLEHRKKLKIIHVRVHSLTALTGFP